jgi:hypothetical protein
MTDSNPRDLFTVYQDAWADIAHADRERLIRSSVAEEAIFTSPNIEGQGIENLLNHIEDFQGKFPGAYFRANSVLEQHGQLLAEWTMFSKDGTEFLTAHSYARFDGTGRFTRLAGFWRL